MEMLNRTVSVTDTASTHGVMSLPTTMTLLIWLMSPQTSLYYSLQVMQDTQGQDQLWQHLKAPI